MYNERHTIERLVELGQLKVGDYIRVIPYSAPNSSVAGIFINPYIRIIMGIDMKGPNFPLSRCDCVVDINGVKL